MPQPERVVMGDWKQKVLILEGDITEEACDVIVNAANEDLEPGGGVCGAIHRAAGPALARECRLIGGCPTGEAVMTRAYDLPCRRVIHTPGPIFGGGSGDLEADLLASCYRESLQLAVEEGFTTIAFPSISTGVYGYPIAEACRIALATVREGLQDFPELLEVRLVCYSAGDLEEYERALDEMD
ncbi:MAG: macro domain-containing protein [Candidatus Krumholzibacteriia bacterium]